MDEITKYKHAIEMYHKSTPIMSDTEFDKFEQDLVTRGIILSREIGTRVDGYGEQYKHQYFMGSQYSIHAYDLENLGWVSGEINKRIILNDSDDKHVATVKFDGCAIDIMYKHMGGGVYDIHKALTRGTGVDGFDITSKLVGIAPKSIQIDCGGADKISIRGELTLERGYFWNNLSKHNKNIDTSLKLYANERNAVSGYLNASTIIKRLKVGLRLNLFMSIFSTCNSDVRIQLTDTNIEFDNALIPCKVAEIYEVDVNNIEQFIHEIINKRDILIDRIDGIVISTKGVKTIEYDNSGCYSNMIAIKLPPVIKPTKVNGIEWGVKQSGEMFPTLLLEPVDIDGSLMTRASGHNASWILKKGCGIGAMVTVQKQGDIIPAVAVVNVESDVLKFPIDSEWIVDSKGDDKLMTTNKDKIQLNKFINNFSGLKMFGFGDIAAEMVWNTGSIKSMSHFITIKLNDFDLINDAVFGVGTKNHTKFKGEFLKMRSTMTAAKLIALAGYVGVGETLGEYIANVLAARNDFYGLNTHPTSNPSNSKAYDTIMSDVEFIQLVRENKEILIFPQPIMENLTGVETIHYILTGSPEPHFKTKALFEKTLPSNYIKVKTVNKADVLILSDPNSTSKKTSTAKDKGKEIRTYESFI